MTHKDIYTKFMIEYDKANVTSSYPSLTEYEVATVLDKAYHALIAQKVTGNNVRRVALEGDLKNITDLAPLMKNDSSSITTIDNTNVAYRTLPEDLLYYVSGKLTSKNGEINPTLYSVSKNGNGSASFSPAASYTYDSIMNKIKKAYPGVDLSTIEPIDPVKIIGEEYSFVMPDGCRYTMKVIKQEEIVDFPMDNIQYRPLPVKLVNHDIADKFIITAHNLPWVKTPVCYIEEKNLYVVYDSVNKPELESPYKFDITYIKTPNKFAKELKEIEDFIASNSAYDDAWQSIGKKLSYFNATYKVDKSDLDETDETDLERLSMINDIELKFYTFECNDTMAEELISLAVAFALENVESQRLNSKLNMRGLEA